MAEAPLISAEAPSEAGLASQSSFLPPSVVVKAPKMPTGELPNSPEALEEWQRSLQKWQEMLEDSVENQSAASSRREEGPVKNCLCWHQDIAGDIPPEGQKTVKFAFATFLMTLICVIWNAIAMTVVKTNLDSDLGELAWSFVLFVGFGTICAFSVYRLTYLSMRNQMQSMISEAMAMQSLQMVVCVIGIIGPPHSGLAGVWSSVEEAAMLSSASLVLSGLAATLWGLSAGMAAATALRLRNSLVEIRKIGIGFGARGLDDAYQRLDEENGASVFSLDDVEDDELVRPGEPPEQLNSMNSAENGEQHHDVVIDMARQKPAPPPDLPKPIPTVGELNSEDEDMFAGAGASSKSRKKKKKKKSSSK